MLRPLPNSPLTTKSLEISDSSDSTSSDVSTIPEDPSDDDNDSDEDENNFDPNAKLPPIPNGNDTSDILIKNLSEEERFALLEMIFYVLNSNSIFVMFQQI